MSATTSAPAAARRSGSMLGRLLRNPLALGAIVVLALLALTAAFAPLLTSADPNTSDLRAALLPPGSPDHLLGTDSAGRDLLARMLYGGRTSLLGALLALAVAAVVGIPSALVAGYYGRWFDTLPVWVSNLIQALPGLVVLLAVRAAVGPSIWIAMAVYGVILSPGFFRVVRTAVINVRHELYVDAARVSGLGDLSIVGRHVLTVVRAPAIIQASLLTGVALAIQSGLEFLGVGDNTLPSWGVILNEGFRNIYREPVMLLWPSLAIGLTCAALVILGNGLRDALEERGTTAVRRSRRRPAPTGPATVVSTRTEHDADLVGSEPTESLAVDLEPGHAFAGGELPADADADRAGAGPLTAPPVAGPPVDPDALLAVSGLRVGYGTGEGLTVVVHGVDLEVREGEVLGLVGESGSGKTQTAFSVLGLLPAGGRVLSGSIRYRGRELTGLDERDLQRLRGSDLAYIPQEPMSNLDPSFRIGSQLITPMRRKLGISKAQATERALALLARVGIPDPQRTFASYPHEISGGMAQRVLIAGAVSCNPKLLIADEPTTALDVTVQAEVLALLRDLQAEYGMGVILVTHNFGVVADICDRVAVMQHGTVVETADVDTIFAAPRHPYTQKLLGSTLEGGPSRVEQDAIQKAATA